MKKKTRNTLAILAIFLIVASLFAARYISQAAPVGTAYFAKVLCSAVFVSGRPPEDVLAVDLALDNPMIYAISTEVDREKQHVSASFGGLFENVAVHRRGLGCTLAIDMTPDELSAQTYDGPMVPPTPWPTAAEGPIEEEPVAQETVEGEPVETAANIDSERLRRAVDAAFEEPDPGNMRRTRAVVVVHDGQLVAERYAEGFDASTALTGWSMTKTVTNALLGILVERGLLDLHAPAPVPEWHESPEDPRGAITLDQLLRMSSGLDFNETYGDPGTDVQQMLFRRSAAGTFAADKPLRTEPDGEWYYSSGTSNILSRIVRDTVEAAGDDYWAFPRQALFGPLGMASATLEPDASGTFVGSSFCFATAQDWARFGLLYLHDGVWDGRRLLPMWWVEYSTTPTPLSGGIHGAHIWLNADVDGEEGSRRWPRLPDDLFVMSGFEEQWVYGVPSKNAVVVRLGMTANRSAWDGTRFLEEVLAALPGAQSSEAREAPEVQPAEI